MAESTINDLLIRIDADSASAADRVKALATALESMKSSIPTSGKTKALSDLAAGISALGASANASGVENASRAISSISEALQTLGSLRLTSVTRTLGKIPEVINGLSSTDMSGVRDKIQSVSDALAPLTNMPKTSSFNSTIRSLGRLGDVTAKLDTKTISDFSERVREVTEAVSPLSAKMTPIATAMDRIGVSAKSSASAVQTYGTHLRSLGEIALAARIKILQFAASLVREAGSALKTAIDDAIEWDGTMNRFVRTFGDFGKPTYDFMQKANEKMGLNIQQWMQYMGIYSSMMEGFGIDTENAGKMALGYSELTYDIWAAYNDIYKTYEEASTAVQSAISGQVRAIRRAGFDITQASLKQTAANHGLAISISDATQAQKEYLIYQTMVDQATQQGVIGQYAHEMNTAEGAVRNLKQQLLSLGQAIGSLFIPLLQKVVPVVTAVVNLIGDAVRQIGKFFGIEMQQIDWSYAGTAAIGDEASDVAGDLADGMGDVGDATKGATAAAEEYKNTILGIDEINPLNDVTGGGGSGGSGGSGGGGGAGGAGGGHSPLFDVNPVWTDSIFDQIKDKVSDIEEKLKDALPIIELIGAALATWNLVEAASKLAAINDTLGMIAKIAASAIIVTIEAVLEYQFASKFLETGDFKYILLEGLNTAIAALGLKALWGTKGIAIALGVSAIMDIVAIGVDVSKTGNISKNDIIQGIFAVLKAGAAGGVLGFSIGGPAGAATGILIGLGVGLALTVGSVVIGKIAKSVMDNAKQQLSAQWGTMHLDDEQVTAYVDRILAVPNVIDIKGQDTGISLTRSLKLYADADIELTNAAEAFSKAEEQLQYSNVNIHVGVSVPQEKIQSEVDDFIQSAQDVLDKNRLKVNMAFGTLGMSDSDAANDFNTASTSLEAQVKAKAEELRQAWSDAWNEDTGEWIPDKEEKAMKIAQELAEMNAKVLEYQTNASVQTLWDQQAGVLDYESFQKSLETSREKLDEYYQQLSDAENTALAGLKFSLDQQVAQGLMTPQAAQDAYEKDSQEIKDQYFSNKLELEFGNVGFALDNLDQATKEMVDKLGPMLQQNLKGLDSFDLTQYMVDDVFNVDTFTDEYTNQISSAFANLNISKETKEQISKSLEAIVPEVQDLESVAQKAREAGQVIPDNIRSSLNDYQQQKAMSGDVDGMYYMLGQRLAKSPQFMQLLVDSPDIGYRLNSSIAEGIMNNSDLSADALAALGVDVSKGMDNLNVNVDMMTKNIGDTLKKNGMTNAQTAKLTNEQVVNNMIPGTAQIQSVKDGASRLTNGYKSQLQTDAPKLYEEASTIGVNTARNYHDSAQNYANSHKVTMAANLVLQKKGWTTLSSWTEQYRGTTPQVSIALSVMANGGAINAYASGTTHAHGSMFLAGENGPEMVGHIGGRTEVMNRFQLASVMKESIETVMEGYMPSMNAMNGNIIRGANGVIRAITEQPKRYSADEEAAYGYISDSNNEGNSLLREQNSLLRQLIEKADNSGTQVSTSMIQTALNRQNRRVGVAVR